jgi:fluoroacetyl-CoA thioesterase
VPPNPPTPARAPSAPGNPAPGASLAVGLRATVRAAVTESDTASAMGSGDVPVLATPRLLALAEAAAFAAVAPQLAEGLTTVGTSVSLEHRRASPLGAEIVVEAELTEVAGSRLVFRFIARVDGTDEDVVLGAGTVERVVVDRARFVARVGAGKADAGRGPTNEAAG